MWCCAYIWCKAVASIIVQYGRFDQADAFYGDATAFATFLRRYENKNWKENVNHCEKEERCIGTFVA